MQCTSSSAGTALSISCRKDRNIRLLAQQLEVTMHTCWRNGGFGGDRAHAPVGGAIRGLGVQGLVNQLCQPPAVVGTLLDLDHDFTLRASLRQVLKRFLCLFKRKHLVNHRMDTFGFEQFADLGELSTVGAYEEK